MLSTGLYEDPEFEVEEGATKAKIKSAGRMLKNAGFNVLGTLTKEEAHKDLTSPDRKGGYGYIEVSMVNNGWLGNPINLLELKKKNTDLYLVIA